MTEWTRKDVPHPIGVTKWMREIEECNSIIDALLLQDVECAIYERQWGGVTRYAVFRERFDNDPEDIEDQLPQTRRMVSCPVSH